MTDALPLSPERLLEETRWLQSLAATLAGPGDADDLAQATWLHALEHGGGIRGLRPWLRTVLRNVFVRSRLRATAAGRRERVVARVNVVPSAADLAARASLHRAVVDAVLSLDEPARSTVLLRFFENKPPREIARIQGVTVEAIHSRLRRAFVTLRTRLDHEADGREAWARFAVPAGALLMSYKTKLAVAAAIVLLIAAATFIAWRLAGVGEVPAPTHAAPAPPERPSLPPVSLTAAPVEIAASRPETAPGSRPVATERPAIHPRIHVSTDDGRDVAGATVLLTPLFSPERLASGTTGLDGEARVELPDPRLATVHVTAAGFADAVIESVPLVDGSRVEVDLVALVSMKIRVNDEAGVPIANASVQLSSESSFGGFGPPDYRRFIQATDETGVAQFAGVPRQRWYIRVHATGYRDLPTGLGDWEVGPGDATVVLARGVDLLVRIEDDQTAAPVPGVRVRISDGQLGAVWIDAVSDDLGTVAVGRLPGRSTRLITRGDLRGDPSMLVVPPEQTTATIKVSTPAPVACKVTREDGTLVEAAILETAHPSQLLPVLAQGGAFLVAGQGMDVAPYFRFVVDGGATPWRRVIPWTAEVSLVVKPSVRISGAVVDPAGRGVAGALIRIDSNDTQRGRYERAVTEALATSDESGRFSATVGGGAGFVMDVSTAAGPCARHIVVVRGDGPGIGMIRVATPFTRVPAGQFAVDVGRIVVPAATGGVRVKVEQLFVEGPLDVVATPLGEIADRFAARRAAIRTDHTAELANLPEGEYDLTVGVRGEPVGFLGLRGLRVRVVDGKTIDVTLPR